MDFAFVADVIEKMTREEFVIQFRAEFAPAIEVQQLAREFQDLRQTTKVVAEITIKFRENALLVSQYATNEEMKKTKYHDMLRDGIRDFVSFSTCWTLGDMLARGRDREINLEHLWKRKPKQVQTIGGPVKRPNTFDQQVRGQ